MSSGTAPTQLRRRAALARLEAEELADAVSELRTASLSKSDLERALERVEALSARVQKALDLSGGLSVAQAAARLEVSEPTVRQRLAEGLLEAIRELGVDYAQGWYLGAPEPAGGSQPLTQCAPGRALPIDG